MLRDATPRQRLLRCYNDVGSLQSYPLARLREPPRTHGLPTQKGYGASVRASPLERLRRGECRQAEHLPPFSLKRRSKSCGERRQKGACFWSRFRISLVVPTTSNDAGRLARSLIFLATALLGAPVAGAAPRAGSKPSFRGSRRQPPEGARRAEPRFSVSPPRPTSLLGHLFLAARCLPPSRTPPVRVPRGFVRRPPSLVLAGRSLVRARRSLVPAARSLVRAG
jgi:hypothetical protein